MDHEVRSLKGVMSMDHSEFVYCSQKTAGRSSPCYPEVAGIPSLFGFPKTKLVGFVDPLTDVRTLHSDSAQSHIAHRPSLDLSMAKVQLMKKSFSTDRRRNAAALGAETSQDFLVEHLSLL